MMHSYTHRLRKSLFFAAFLLAGFALAAQGNPDDFIRTYDGTNNNPYHPQWGAAGINLRRKMAASYDGDGSTMYDFVNPRTVSNAVAAQSGDQFDAEGRSALLFGFMQFLDHDITATPESEEAADIEIPMGDPLFDPFMTGLASMHFTRSEAAAGTGDSADSPREQMNAITAWIDGSGVYGSDEERATWLRSGTQGKLKAHWSTNGWLLPCNTPTGDCNGTPSPAAPFMAGDRDRCGNLLRVFVAGDVRANEQPSLTALHTLFLREHNRICDVRVSQGHTDDEENYQYARRRVGALIQSITYNEMLPNLGIRLPDYTGYRPSVRPDIFNVFATAAYRLGHTMVNSNVAVTDAECGPASLLGGHGPGTEGVYGGTGGCFEAPTTYTLQSPIGLRDAFFNPSLVANNGIDGILRGAARQRQQRIDTRIVDDIRNFLFGPPGAGGLDLAALNIQRGRDHGLPKFNKVREAFNLDKVSIDELTSDPEIREGLRSVYGEAKHIDAWVGMLAEDHMNNAAIGATLYRILKQQFLRLRNGDRYFYLTDVMLSNGERQQITQTTLADLIARNTGVSDLGAAFYAQPCQPDYCDSKATLDFFEWIRWVGVNGRNYQSAQDGGYGDYTHRYFEGVRGLNNTIDLRPGYRSTSLRERWRVYIDLNQDGDFDDTGEMVYNRSKRGRATGTFPIPDEATLGLTRMRVIMSGSGYAGPCDNPTYGETEDYTIEIIDRDPDGRYAAGALATGPAPLEADIELVRLLPYPNPAVDQVTVAYRLSQETSGLELQLADAQGRVVLQQALGTGRAGENIADLTVGHLPAGFYTVILRGDSGRQQAPLAIIRP